MNPPDNLVPRVANLETLMQYMAETQRQLSSNQELLTSIVQNQHIEMQTMRQMLERMEERIRQHDEAIMVIQGQIRLLLEKLLGNA